MQTRPQPLRMRRPHGSGVTPAHHTRGYAYPGNPGVSARCKLAHGLSGMRPRVQICVGPKPGITRTLRRRRGDVPAKATSLTGASPVHPSLRRIKGLPGWKFEVRGWRIQGGRRRLQRARRRRRGGRGGGATQQRTFPTRTRFDGILPSQSRNSPKPLHNCPEAASDAGGSPIAHCQELLRP